MQEWFSIRKCGNIPCHINRSKEESHIYPDDEKVSREIGTFQPSKIYLYHPENQVMSNGVRGKQGKGVPLYHCIHATIRVKENMSYI